MSEGALTMFIPLIKADAAKRLVYGAFDETPDRAGEVCDYATAKPAFQSWSDGMAKASGGQNLGNIRGQHDLKKAAGKLVSIEFDDAAKRIQFCAKIVDDQEWAKVEECVYTGFSPGGSYAKRWQDGSHYRYTPKVGELSIVDVPCNPAATFTMVKADGAEEQVEFVLGKAYEPGNDVTKVRAEDMAKAAPGTSFKDHVVQARADLIAENAAEALADMAKMMRDQDAAGADAHSVPGGASDAARQLNAALAKADAALSAGDTPVSPARAYAAAINGELIKCDTALVIAPPSPEAAALIGADLVKSIAAAAAIRTAAAPVLAKGLYSLGDAVSSLQSFAWITQDVCYEACEEGDGSKLPQMAVDLLTGMKAFLIAMVEEEVSEMLARTKAEAGENFDLMIEGETMELASKIIDLVKSNTALMAKAGARNSSTDSARIQSIHDKACELGAGCADAPAVEKVAALALENEVLTKSVQSALPRVEALTEEIRAIHAARDADRAAMAKMAAQIETLGEQPALTKVQIAASKAEDNGTHAITPAAEETYHDKLRKASPAVRAQMILSGRH